MKTFKLAPYPVTLHVTGDRDEYSKVLAAHDMDPSTEGCAGSVFEVDGNIYLGVFDGKLGTLVHEAAHAVFDVAKRISYDPTYEQEPYCYMLEHVFNKARKALAL